MPHSVHTRTPSDMSNARTSSSTMSSAADQFPKPVGATLVAPPADRDQFSPAQSSFSFEEVPSMSPHGFTEGECLVDRKNITRAVEWGAPGEKKDPIGGPNRGHKSQRKTQYYEGQFNERDTTGPARERITKDTPIVAELKTNVIVRLHVSRLLTSLGYSDTANRSRTSTLLLQTSPTRCPSASSVLSIPLWSAWITPPAFCWVAHSSRRTCSPSLPSLPNSNP